MQAVTISPHTTKTRMFPGAGARERVGERSTKVLGPYVYRGGSHTSHPKSSFHPELGFDELAFNSLVGHAYVYDLSDVDDQIEFEHLTDRDLGMHERIVIKTAHSHSTNPRVVPFAHDLMEHLAAYNPELVAIDQNITRDQNVSPQDTYGALLDIGTTLLEGLNLEDVSEGGYMLVALPHQNFDNNNPSAFVQLLTL